MCELDGIVAICAERGRVQRVVILVCEKIESRAMMMM